MSRQALGRVLADDVVSPFDVPAHDNSAMDGYAVRFADLSPDRRDDPRPRRRIVRRQAERRDARTRGECVRIMTGRVMPDGADTVVMQERVRVEGERVLVPRGALRRRGRTAASPART